MLKDGAGSLVERLRVRISPSRVLSCEVLSVRRAGAGFAVKCDSGIEVAAKKVFCCANGQGTANCLIELDAQLAERFAAIEYAPLAVVHLEADPSTVPHDSFGVLFGSEGPPGLLGVMYKSGLFPHTSPAGRSLVTVCLGGTRNRQIFELGDPEISEKGARYVSDTLGIETLRSFGVCRWERAIPQPKVGLPAAVEKLRKLESGIPGIYFAGSDLGGVGVPDRVAAARAAVERSLNNNAR